MKRVLITGITGMVGSHLLDYLILNTNYNITGLVRWRSSLDNIQRHIENLNTDIPRINLFYGDLNDKISINDLIKSTKPDYIFHLAAQSYPTFSFQAPNVTYETNIIGTSNLCDSILKYSPNSIVHVCSSSEVYGKVDKKKLPIDESCSFHPASPYAISKVGTDLIAQHYAEAYNLNIQITRMFTHTGPRRGDVFAESSFAKQIAMIENGFINPIVKVGNLRSMRTIADVRDAVEAYFLLLTKNPISGSIYNIGGSFSCEIGDILDFLISISTNKDIKYEVDTSRLRPIDADNQIPNCTKFNNHTGWKPKISFEQTLEDLLNFWRDQIKKYGNSFLQR